MTARFDRSGPQRVLAELLIGAALGDGRAAGAEGVAALPNHEVLAATDLHRLTPAVYRTLRDTHGLSEEWLAPLAFRRHEQLMRHLRAVEDLKHVGAVLDAAVFHAAQAGANLLVWLADIRFAAAQPGFDWPEFERRIRRARFEVPAAMVVARVERTLGFLRAPSPGVLRPAAGVWGRLAALRDARSSFPGLPGDPHLSGAMYSSARRGLIRTVSTSGRSYVAVRRIEAQLDDPGQGEGRILHRDVPDDDARRAYLDRTENAARP